jgi:hypothetical protein
MQDIPLPLFPTIVPYMINPIKPIRICEGESNLYKLGTLISSLIDASPCIDTITHDIPNRRSCGLWHQRLGHINVQKMKLMHQQLFLYFIF